MAAEQRRLEHRQRQRVLAILRQEGEAARDLAAREPPERLTAEHYRAGGRRTQSGERVQREALATAIAAEPRR